MNFDKKNPNLKNFFGGGGGRGRGVEERERERGGGEKGISAEKKKTQKTIGIR